MGAQPWRCHQPLRDNFAENICRPLRMQALAREVEVGSTFDEKLHDLKSRIVELRHADYVKFWKTHTPGVDAYFESSSSESSEETLAQCPLCRDGMKPEHQTRTPCCFKAMHRQCLKTHVETAVDDEAAFNGEGVATPHKCPMCRKDWDMDAPIETGLVGYYRDFVQMIENMELSDEELGIVYQPFR